MVLEDEKRRLEPSESEPVAVYCRRVVQLQSDLANANRVVADVSTDETVLEGLERERPEWTVLLQGLKEPEAYASRALHAQRGTKRQHRPQQRPTQKPPSYSAPISSPGTSSPSPIHNPSFFNILASSVPRLVYLPAFPSPPTPIHGHPSLPIRELLQVLAQQPAPPCPHVRSTKRHRRASYKMIVHCSSYCPRCDDLLPEHSPCFTCPPPAPFIICRLPCMPLPLLSRTSCSAYPSNTASPTSHHLAAALLLRCGPAASAPCRSQPAREPSPCRPPFRPYHRPALPSVSPRGLQPLAR
jgi:hypothetical protein